MQDGPILVKRFPQDLAVTAMALLILLVFYLAAESKLRNQQVHRFHASDGSDSESPFRSARRYIWQGILITLAGMALVSFAAERKDWLMRVTAFLIFFCIAGFSVLPGLAVVFMARLWKGLAMDFRGVRLWPLLKALPKSALGLGLGLGGFLALGWILERTWPKGLSWFGELGLTHVFQVFFFFILAYVFWKLWTSRTAAALLARAGLILIFSLILLGGFGLYAFWLATEHSGQTALWPSAAGLVNTVFYFRLMRAAGQDTNEGGTSGGAASGTM